MPPYEVLRWWVDDAKREQAKRDTGKRVRQLREQRGWSVQELAEAAGVPRQYVYDLEGGVRVSITNIVAASIGLNVSVDYLLGRDQSTHGHTHDCCETEARIDVLRRRIEPSGAMIRLPDGTVVPWGKLAHGGPDEAMVTATGEDIKLIRCGEYTWKGERWRVGEEHALPPISSAKGSERSTPE
jgi:transcriptional regulator with XRE-family HTH domain